MFHELIESSPHRSRRAKSTFLISVIAHLVVVCLILIVPLIYYQALPNQELLTFLAPPPPAPPHPPPPPPPPPAPAEPSKPWVIRIDPKLFTAPPMIPKDIPPPLDDIPVFSSASSSPGGIPGGFGAQIPGIGPNLPVQGLYRPPPPPPPPPARKEPIRMGGVVQASRLFRRVEPSYPELAKRARVQGVVLVQVTIDELGNVAEVKVIRGHPLLDQAAVEAVSQWKYSPTLLNGEPVSVIATVTVNFVLK